METIKMYTIISPPGYHGILGRNIEESLQKERAKRCVKTKVKQYTSKKECKQENQKKDIRVKTPCQQKSGQENKISNIEGYLAKKQCKNQKKSGKL